MTTWYRHNHEAIGTHLGIFCNPRPFPGRGFFVFSLYSEYHIRVSYRPFFTLFRPKSRLTSPAALIFFSPFPNLTSGQAPGKSLVGIFLQIQHCPDTEMKRTKTGPEQ